MDKNLALASRFLVHDCRLNQKKLGIAAYNKIKHGLLVVPSALEYVNSMPDTPATIYPNKQYKADSEQDPFILWAFPMDDARIVERERAIHFVQKILRLLVALYLSANYREEVRKKWGGGPDSLFQSDDLRDVREHMREVTLKT